ncbi:hypothetical protein LEP1GSC202_0683 [Leptospira yanagawae serovar Saopaulo str. Sao Paulo = ATCC 700523]|uniref:Uncharacterized protein n=1 Tax=Leptospira yanagawae serovar Saopaulo str. Sao Paulo = ATCC 700523 TaxID=1249483 RepID=A0A5E8HFP0_9LEPT|nr:hypothetical protein LEP1GSC202_0683 [Leptospira yanagawae serovar Saopaulo str. Sao Paulo = ATCC 700523]
MTENTIWFQVVETLKWLASPFAAWYVIRTISITEVMVSAICVFRLNRQSAKNRSKIHTVDREYTPKEMVNLIGLIQRFTPKRVLVSRKTKGIMDIVSTAIAIPFQKSGCFLKSAYFIMLTA